MSVAGSLPRIGIERMGYYVPEAVQTSEYIAAASGIPREVIEGKFGIKQRHKAGPGEQVTDLGVKACLEALGGLDPAELDLVVYCGSEYKDYYLFNAAPYILTLLIMIGGAYWLFFQEMARSGENADAARTAVVNTVVMVETVYLFSCRSLNHSLFTIGVFTNRMALIGALALVALQLFFTYSPMMNRLFGSTPLDATAWGWIMGVSIFSFAAVELEKWIRFGGGRGGDRPPE